MEHSSFNLFWTAKTGLSSRIQDPLGMYVLKFLEDYFLPGITTQTERLRYFSFLTWAWKKIRDENLSWDKILDMEKVLALAAALHHIDDSNPPLGIRNKRDAAEYLNHHKIISIDEFTSFGRNNKEGYGNFYYKGPLKTLQILWREDNTIKFSSVGYKIATLIDNIAPTVTEIFLKRKLSKRELSKLCPYCFCGSEIPASESKIWKMVFFGFTKLTKDKDLKIDFDSYQDFENGKVVVPQTLGVPSELSEEEYLQPDKESILTVLAQDHRRIMERALRRRYTLFLIMKIIAEAEPEITNLDQTIRDAIYFKQVYMDNNELKNLDFGELERLRKLWEVYVHNLYYISIFEFTLQMVLEKMEEKTLGITLDAVISSFDLRKMEETMEKYGITIGKQDPEIVGIESQIRDILVGRNTNLEKTLNERKLFLQSLESESYEGELANLLLLLILLKYRYQSFNKDQLEILAYKESGLFSLKPSNLYNSLLQGKISEFIREVFVLVKNRHRYIASMKYYYFGTRSWLFTEEDSFLYYYGRGYWAAGYREAKWRNVVELLLDMKLLKKDGKKLSLSEEGKVWLTRIT